MPNVRIPVTDPEALLQELVEARQALAKSRKGRKVSHLTPALDAFIHSVLERRPPQVPASAAPPE